MCQVEPKTCTVTVTQVEDIKRALGTPLGGAGDHTSSLGNQASKVGASRDRGMVDVGLDRWPWMKMFYRTALSVGRQ